MAISGIFFLINRIFEIILLIPVVGMLAYFVHAYTSSNTLTPDFILILFITGVLGLAWTIATTIAYLRARHSAMFVALVDLGFVGALIAGVYYLRGIAGADCSNFTAGGFYFDLGPLGYLGRSSNNPWSFNVNKTCAMLKASFALGIILIILFFLTFLFALLVAHHHRRDNEVVVKRTRSHHSSRHGGRSGSRSREYYSNPPRRSRSHHSSSRRQYYV